MIEDPAAQSAGLNGPQLRLLERLALHPGLTISARTAAAIAGSSEDDVISDLDALVGAGRLRLTYVVHDPGRHRGRDAAAMDAGEVEAFRRLLDELLREGAAAQLAIIPDSPYLGRYLKQPPVTTFTEPDALAWMELELATLVAVQQVAMDLRMHREVWELAEICSGLFSRRGRYTSWAAMCTLGLRAARAMRYVDAEARMHIGMSELYVAVLDPVKAAFEARSALRLAVGDGSRQGEAAARESLGLASLATGNHEEAWIQFTAAHDIWEDLQDPRAVSLIKQRQGETALAAGRISDARKLLMEALRYFAAVAPESYMHGRIMLSRARVHIANGNLEGAEIALGTALSISLNLGTLREQSDALTLLAEIADLQNSPSLANARRETAAKLDTVLATERRALTGVLGS